MPIEYEVSTLDGVEEGLREVYEQADGGKFRLNLDKFAETQKAPLVKKNAELLNEKKQLDQKLKGSQSAEERVVDLERQVAHYKLTVPLRDIALKAGVFEDRLDIAMLDLEKRFALGDDGQIQVLDHLGNPMPGMTPEKFFDKVYPEQRPYLFKARGGYGSGAGGHKVSYGSGSSKTVTRAAYEAMGANERMEFFKNGGRLSD